MSARPICWRWASRSIDWVPRARRCSRCVAKYVTFFHPRLIGLTGSAAQIRKAASAYRAYFAKVAISGGNEYTVDHSSFIYLMDRGGKYLGFFPPGTSAEQMAQVIRPHLSAPEPR